MPELGPRDFPVENDMFIAPENSPFNDDTNILPLRLRKGETVTVKLELSDSRNWVTFASSSGFVLVSLPPNVKELFEKRMPSEKTKGMVANRIHEIQGLPYEAADYLYQMMQMPSRE